MNKQPTKTPVPKLRFPEFKGAWEVRRLGDVSNVVASGDLDKELFSPVQTNTHIYPVYSNALEKEGLYGYYSLSKYPENSITITARGNLGFAFFRKNKFMGIGRLIVVSKLKKIHPYFLTNCWNHTIHIPEEVTSIPQLTAVSAKAKTLILPPLPEQQKIAACLTSIDDLITAEAQKLDALKTHKKGLMQQFFPCEGEVIPRLRFPEFRNAEGWKEKQLGDILSVGNGRDHKHLADGNIPVYGSGGYMRSVNEYLYDGESVCIGRKGTIDNPIFLSGKFWTVDTLFYTHSYMDCLPFFAYAIFQNINWLDHNQAGGIPSLSKANIEKIDVAVPTLSEQQKIAECLASIDGLITAKAQKLDALKTHKKGLMQQLFPTSNEVNV